jgi:hypothetical protein
MAAAPSTIARAAGASLLVTVVLGGVALGAVLTPLIDTGEPGAALRAASEHAATYRIGVALLAIEMVAQVIVVVLWYRLMKPAGVTLTLVATALGIVGVAIKTVARAGLIAPLFIEHHGLLENGFTAEQRADIAGAAVTAGDIASGIGVLFLGASTVCFSVLMYRSGYVPRAIGAVAGVAALGWLVFADPVLGSDLFMPISMVALVGALTLVVRFRGWGVDDEVWAARAAAL